MVTFDVENSEFQSSRVDDTVVLKYKENAFSLLMDIAIRDEYLKLVNSIDDTHDIRGSVTINDTGFDDEAGIKALLELVGSSDDSQSRTNFLSENTIAKFRNSFGRRILLNITMLLNLVIALKTLYLFQ